MAERRQKFVSLKLVPVGEDRFLVRATVRSGVFQFKDNPIGSVAMSEDGSWAHSSATTPHAGPVYGKAKTAARAAAECFRSHRSWVGY